MVGTHIGLVRRHGRRQDAEKPEASEELDRNRCQQNAEDNFGDDERCRIDPFGAGAHPAAAWLANARWGFRPRRYRRIGEVCAELRWAGFHRASAIGIVRRRRRGRKRQSILGRPCDGHARYQTSNVLSKIRKDFSDGGVVQSDEQILRVMNQFLLEAASQEQTARADASDAALVQIARNLQSR